MNAVCLIFDRLHVGHVGAYGNSWIRTPTLDRLASEGFVFDHVLVDTPRLERLYRSYWQGWHALAPPPDSRPSLPALLGEMEVTTALLTDDRALAEHPLAGDFDQLVQIDPPWEPRVAEQFEQTQLARCFVEAIEWLESAPQPFLLWCHLASLGTAWDAPLSFREAYSEAGDPDPPEFAEPPERMLPEDHDPDEVLGIGQAYAGQVSLLDMCLGAFRECLASSPGGAETLIVLGSARGFPLGEHLRVGPCDDALYAELVQVPLMIRSPDLCGASARSQALVEPSDLWATLVGWWSVPEVPPSPTARNLMPVVRQEAGAWRDRLCLAAGGRPRAVRTPAWYLRSAPPSELFAKPDDRWEVNDVADRCGEVVASLEEVLGEYGAALQTGKSIEPSPLDEVLVSGLE